MDFLIETILEIVLEGCLYITPEKKFPIIIRLILGVITAAFYAGLIGIIIYVALKNNSVILFAVAVLAAVIIAYEFWENYKKIKNK